MKRSIFSKRLAVYLYLVIVSVLGMLLVFSFLGRQSAPGGNLSTREPTAVSVKDRNDTQSTAGATAYRIRILDPDGAAVPDAMLYGHLRLGDPLVGGRRTLNLEKQP
jgi:hypothetical protein